MGVKRGGGLDGSMDVGVRVGVSYVHRDTLYALMAVSL